MTFPDVENKLTEFIGFADYNPLSRVSYNEIYKYNNVKVDTRHNISNKLFKDFISSKIFKIGESDYSNGCEDASHYYSAFHSDGNNSYLAGTLLTWKFNGGYDQVSSTSVSLYPFNMGILIEETLSSTGQRLSMVDIKLREQEPLMQSIVDCNGKVYDFKQGVKFSDFKYFLEKKKDENNLIKYDVLVPTNISKGEFENGKKVNTCLPDNDDDRYVSVAGEPESAVFNTNFRGYLIMCSFNKDTSYVTKVDSLIEKEPVITVIRLIDNKLMKNNGVQLGIGSKNYNIIGNNNSNYDFHFSRIFTSLRDSCYMKSCKNNYEKNQIMFDYYILEETKKEIN